MFVLGLVLVGELLWIWDILGLALCLVISHAFFTLCSLSRAGSMGCCLVGRLGADLFTVFMCIHVYAVKTLKLLTILYLYSDCWAFIFMLLYANL